LIITREQAEQLLRADLQEAEDAVSNLVTVPLNENQFSALVSFVFNLGAGELEDSTLLELLNQGKYSEAADQFLRFNTDNGEPLEGLTRRREAERQLFLTPPAI
jgi:GH24 family phage-related lysozyme (muramidase)